VTVKIWPAMVNVPVRVVVAVFAATAIVAVPLPLPLPPALTVSQAALLVVDHAQELPAVTLTDVDSPAAGEVRVFGEIAYVHAAPACVTVKVWPAIVNVPVRLVLAVFAAALKVTDPVPLPVAPDVTVSQPAALLAVHAQPVAAVTVTLPVDAAAGTDAAVADKVGVQTVEYEKLFDRLLAVVPPGPAAATRA
jgi:hypothetical protein